MVFKLGLEAQKTWKRIEGYRLIPKVLQGITCIDGKFWKKGTGGIIMGKGMPRKNSHTQLLTYLLNDVRMLNEEIIREGCASHMTVSSNIKYQDRF